MSVIDFILKLQMKKKKKVKKILSNIKNEGNIYHFLGVFDH